MSAKKGTYPQSLITILKRKNINLFFLLQLYIKVRSGTLDIRMTF
jgi:hypothetical protein